jgi:hypothetical protein
VTNASGRFIDVYTGWPGSVNDARIWSNSPLRASVSRRLPPQYHLVADGGYAIEPWMMIPYRMNEMSADPAVRRLQRRHNYSLSSTRTVVEHAFGHLKGRFRWLKGIHTRGRVETIPHLVLTACILHNYCLDNNDLYDRRWNDSEDDEQERRRLARITGDAVLEERLGLQEMDIDIFNETIIAKAKREEITRGFDRQDPYIL